MITHVSIADLPEELRPVVLAKYRVALMDPNRRLTMLECAWLYGYRFDYIRWLSAQGKLRTIGTGTNRRVTHAAMRQYRQRRVKCIPNKVERNAQQRIA
jgi:hypothetical protein